MQPVASITECVRVRKHAEYVVEALTAVAPGASVPRQALGCTRYPDMATFSGPVWGAAVQRRYDDFVDLRKVVKAPSAAFPGGLYYVMHSEDSLQKRQEALALWLHQVVQADPELRCPELRGFLGVPGVAITGKGKEGNGTAEHVDYAVAVAVPGFPAATVYHRYTDFEGLRAAVSGQYTLPEFPGKGFGQFFQAGFMDARQRDLSAWLGALFAADLSPSGVPQHPALRAFLGVAVAPPAQPTGITRKLARWGLTGSPAPGADAGRGGLAAGTGAQGPAPECETEQEWLAAKKAREHALFAALRGIEQKLLGDITKRDKLDLQAEQRKLVSANQVSRAQEMRSRNLLATKERRAVEAKLAGVQRELDMLKVRDLTQRDRIAQKVQLDRQVVENKVKLDKVALMESRINGDRAQYDRSPETAAL